MAELINMHYLLMKLHFNRKVWQCTVHTRAMMHSAHTSHDAQCTHEP